MFHCQIGVGVIEQHAIILIATVRSPTVYTLFTAHTSKHSGIGVFVVFTLYRHVAYSNARIIQLYSWFPTRIKLMVVYRFKKIQVRWYERVDIRFQLANIHSREQFSCGGVLFGLGKWVVSRRLTTSHQLPTNADALVTLMGLNVKIVWQGMRKKKFMPIHRSCWQTT